MKAHIQLIAFDLDGTLTQHKTQLDPYNKAVLDDLAKYYRLLIVGAGSCRRIHNQVGRYPLDIIGNYGMQVSRYHHDSGMLEIIEDTRVPVHQEIVRGRISLLRKMSGYETFCGETVEFHDSGMITFPLLGTSATLADKLRFDPAREKRKVIYGAVKELFQEYTVFIGGSSSFDIVPLPYCKRYALEKYCRSNGIPLDQVIYAGDDYGSGGNDEDIYRSSFAFVPVDDYTRLVDFVRDFL